MPEEEHGSSEEGACRARPESARIPPGLGRVSEESRADRRWGARSPGALQPIHCKGLACGSGEPLEGSEPGGSGICVVF